MSGNHVAPIQEAGSPSLKHDNSDADTYELLNVKNIPFDRWPIKNHYRSTFKYLLSWFLPKKTFSNIELGSFACNAYLLLQQSLH